MENEIIQDVMALHGGGIERMLNESPEKRNRLKNSVKESKEVVANIMDRISLHQYEQGTLFPLNQSMFLISNLSDDYVFVFTKCL